MNLCATIIDDRSDPESVNKIISVTREFESLLPDGTEFNLFIGQDVYPNFKAEFNRDKNVNVFLLTRKVDIDQYNNILTTPEFWDDHVKYDRVLIFQTDARILRAGIEEFYEWDYVGAEWKFPPWRGNGGLSLRNPKVMKHICEIMKYDPSVHGQEDVYFCNIINGDNRYSQNFIGYTMSLAPVNVCKKFSVESIFELGSLGCHAIEKYLTPEQCKEIYEQYN